jgi:hypothetical protein
MSDELRRELSIRTGLEKVVLDAVRANRSVVIAGTAGSGKTHLIRIAGDVKSHDVVPDLAALPETKWGTLFSQRSPVIVAGNEGAFIAGVRRRFEGYDVTIDLLHAVQNGQDITGKGPVVIDAAGYDPAGNHAIAEMLCLPILAKYVEAKADPLMTAGWHMLSDALSAAA